MADLTLPDGATVDEVEWRKNRRPVLEEDPTNTEYVLQLWTIANLIERNTQMYLSASQYGKVVAELRAQYDAPTDNDPPYLLMGKVPQLTVFNAGTDDEAAINRMNADTPGAIDFQAKKQKLRRY